MRLILISSAADMRVDEEGLAMGHRQAGPESAARAEPDAAQGVQALAALAGFLVVYATFDVLPIVLPKEDVVEGVRWGDLADAPLLFLLVGAYVLLGLQAGLWHNAFSRLGAGLALVVLIQGHGIHMAANTISAYLDPSSSGWRPAYFIDEHWGHTELQAGIIMLSLLFVTAARPTGDSRLGRYGTLLLATVYGLFLTADAIEGQTVFLMLPSAIALALIGFLMRKRKASLHRSFFAWAFATTVAALAAYWLWHGGFPEHDWHVWQELPLGL